MMGTAMASGPDRSRIAAEQAVVCPLLEGMDLSGAKGVLVLITATKNSLKLKETQLAMNTIRAFASTDAHVIFGTAYDESLNEQMRVTVVGTGLTGRSATNAPPVQAAAAATNAPNASNAPTAANKMQQRADSLFHIPPHIPAMDTAHTLPIAPEPTNRPAVWRPTRNPATLPTSGRSDHGAEDYEVPAYLRKRVE
jgi:cell division protein FtsZ